MLVQQRDDGRRRGQSVELETSIDICGLRTGAHHVRRRSLAQDGTKGVDDDRFAGAGFSGERVETGSKVDPELVHDGEVAYFEIEQHDGLIRLLAMYGRLRKSRS